MEEITLAREDFAQITSAAEFILAKLAHAQGRAESYAARRAEFKILQFPTQQKTPSEEGAQQAETAFLEFTNKELSRMPKQFRTIFKLKGGKVAHVRQKENGTYEIRYRRDGFNISVSSKNLADAKERFILALCEAKTDTMNDKTFFGQYAMQWLEVVKKPHVKEITLHNYKFTLQTYVFPKFGKMRLRDIKPLDVQKLLNGLEAKGLQRSAGNVYVIFKPLFEFAVAEDLIIKSPMALIKKPKFETKHGQPLTVEEERIFIEKCITRDFKYRYAYILMIFTGIRRSELASAVITPQWVTVVSAKTRKGEAEKIRKIPVSPMLKPFLPFMTKENLTVDLNKLTKGIPKFLPGHHLHELRHTFITRAQECGISRELVSVWAGHKADNSMTTNVYTHFSDEHQLIEIQKLRY